MSTLTTCDFSINMNSTCVNINFLIDMFQSECKSKAPSGVPSPGAVVDTSAGNLGRAGVKAIYHTSCPPYSDNSCQQVQTSLTLCI